MRLSFNLKYYLKFSKVFLALMKNKIVLLICIFEKKTFNKFLLQNLLLFQFISKEKNLFNCLV